MRHDYVSFDLLVARVVEWLQVDLQAETVVDCRGFSWRMCVHVRRYHLCNPHNVRTLSTTGPLMRKEASRDAESQNAMLGSSWI
jgi:hypothetical protein